jgi:hypothetical protein
MSQISGTGAMNFRPPFPARLPDPDAVGYPQAVEAYLARLRAFYNTRASWHRRFYRSTGIVVILIGATLPLLALIIRGGAGWASRSPDVDLMSAC